MYAAPLPTTYNAYLLNFNTHKPLLSNKRHTIHSSTVTDCVPNILQILAPRPLARGVPGVVKTT